MKARRPAASAMAFAAGFPWPCPAEASTRSRMGAPPLGELGANRLPGGYAGRVRLREPVLAVTQAAVSGLALSSSHR